jgi:hypothetical protein
MAPQRRTRQEIIKLLGRAAVQAQLAEEYRAAVGGPGRLEGQDARQAACDAAAMQLIELAGYAEGFGQDRGEPGTTLARLDDALRPVFRLRNMHTHPEMYLVPPAVTPHGLRHRIEDLKSAMQNLDSETERLLAPNDIRVLKQIAGGLRQIEKDGLPDPAWMRPRDLNYAGYYREIQYARLAKETKEFDLVEGGIRTDPRYRDVRRSISDGDNMAHRFHELRRGADRSKLPPSVVAPNRRDRVPGRPISELIRELRREFQTPAERVTEVQMAENTQRLEQYRGAVDGLAQDYTRITGDAKAAALIRALAERRVLPLDLKTIEGMREGLRAAADPAGDYLALPEAVQKACLGLCFGLEALDDRRLIGILDAADARSRAVATTIGDRLPRVVFDEGEEREQDRSLKDSQGYSRWTGEPVGETAGQTQSAGKGQSHR